MNCFTFPQTDALLVQAEGLLRCRSISSALVIAVENKPGMACNPNVPFTANLSWTLWKRMSVHLYTRSRYLLPAYRSYISRLASV